MLEFRDDGSTFRLPSLWAGKDLYAVGSTFAGSTFEAPAAPFPAGSTFVGRRPRDLRWASQRAPAHRHVVYHVGGFSYGASSFWDRILAFHYMQGL